jgi:hypothetical protein
MAWDYLLISVLCICFKPELVLFDLHNNFGFATFTKEGNKQTIQCHIMA